MSATAAPHPPLRRRPGDGEIAGVCAGLGRRFGLDPVLFRIAFVATAVTGGLGVALYALAWAFVPAAAGQPTARRNAREIAGIALLAIAGLGILRTAGVWLGGALAWPVVLAAAGLAVLYSPGGGARRGPFGLGVGWPRVLLGGALIVLSAVAFLDATDALQATGNALVGMAVLVVALGLLFGPFFARLGRTLRAERAERIRSQERAELAAHLHDSVLQTLALIQRRSGEPREVAALARRQERELRGWLGGGATQRAPGESLVAALQEAAAEIEDLHGAHIEVVAVGDRKLDERRGALVQAAREALANAARFAPDEPISLYVEASEDGVEVFVRDRGPGFDPAAVPADRRGVRESIVGRMARHGGRAAIHAQPGAGTEVVLRMDDEPG